MSKLFSRCRTLAVALAAVAAMALPAPAQTAPAGDATPTNAPAAGGLFQLNAEQLDADLRALVGQGGPDGTIHRLAGFQEGSLRAGKHVFQRLIDMGFADGNAADANADPAAAVFVQDVPLAQPTYEHCQLIVDGDANTAVRLYPMRSNILLAPVTPAKGLSGMTAYLGSGELEDYGQRFPHDKIAVLDMDAADNWLPPFAMGAKAVVFIEGDEPVDNPTHHVNMPANLPRFYIRAEDANRLELRQRPRQITIRAKARWHSVSARNIVAVVRGTDATLSGTSPSRQAIVLGCPLDSLSEVPQISPGARQAANAAALMQLAGHLRANPLERDVAICFFDAQTQALAGPRAFYAALFRPKVRQASTLSARRAEIDEERQFRLHVRELYQDIYARAQRQLHLLGMDERLDPAELERLADQEIQTNDQGQPADPNAAVRRDWARYLLGRGPLPEPRRALVTPEMERREYASVKLPALNILKNEARSRADEQMEQLRVLRLDRRDLRQLTGRLGEQLQAGGPETTELQARLADANQRLEALQKRIDAGRTIQLMWNHVQRDLHYEKLDEDAPAAERRRVLIAMTELGGGGMLSDMMDLQTRRLAELDELKTRLNQEEAIHRMLGDGRVVLHLAINLGDQRDRWSFIHGDDSVVDNNDDAGIYSQVYRQIGRTLESHGSLVPGLYTLPLQQTYDVRTFAPGLYADSSGAARIVAVYNLSVMTMLDRRAAQGQPVDTIDRLNVPVLARQFQEFGRFLRPLAANPDLPTKPGHAQSARFDETGFRNAKGTGGRVTSATGGLRALPERDAFVGAAPRLWNAIEAHQTPPGFVPEIRVRTNLNGAYALGMVHETYFAKPIAFASVFDTQGVPTSVTSEMTIATNPKQAVKIQLFQSQMKTVVAYGLSRGTMGTQTMRAASTAEFPPDSSLTCEAGSLLTLFAPQTADGFKLFNARGVVALNNRETPEGYLGKGVGLANPFEHPFTVDMTAHDLRVLNDYRLELLQENRINQDSLADLDGEGKDLEELGREQLAQLRGTRTADEGEQATVDSALGLLTAASGYYQRVYGPLVGVLNDLVTAVVLLLLLAIPFAYALERLLIGTPHIYRQIGWFGALFLMTFAVLYMVNPAFKIASTPIIIFLAFAIILLACLVIFILVRKLQTEIRKMQGMASTVHSADVSRLSTMMAAVNMGISTMRRRPVRTILTAITVVLLTFTILTFASFGTEWGVAQTYQSPLTGGPRIMVRHTVWNPLERGMFESLRGFLAGRAKAVPRLWVAPTAAQAKAAASAGRELMKLALRGDLAGRPVPLAAAVGLDPRDLAEQEFDQFLEGDASLITDPDGKGIFLTEAARDWLELTAEDVGKAKLVFNGYEFIYAGTISYAFASETMLEGSSWLPVDYESSGLADPTASEAAAAETMEVQSNQNAQYSADKLVLTPRRIPEQMARQIPPIPVYPENPETVEQIGKAIAKVTNLPTFIGSGGAVERLKFASLTKASGFQDLLIPVLLGGMIIFATMLGSVSDREREIYTFSSLGLAPPHIASLFFAEAAVYAVVGGMGGYLLGQVVARVLGYFATLGWVGVPPMNYSSTNAIVTILIVMATVLISTIYPALKASRSANPGIQRSWRIPRPQENLYDLVFPFTVSAYDIVGVVSFLKEHFDNYSDTSLGSFATSEVHIFRQTDNDMLGLRAEMALAPFDLGVTQKFALLSQPSEIEGIDEVRILICRLSGARGDWQRSNRVFINDLRKQLLIWRSLPDDVMDRYRQETLDQWNQLPTERIDRDTFGEQA